MSPPGKSCPRFVLLAGLVLAGCGGGSEEHVEAPPAELAEPHVRTFQPSSEGIAPRTAASRPANRLHLSGVEAGTQSDDLHARIRFDGIGEPVPVFLESIPPNRAALIVPLHPGGGLDGGRAAVEVFIGELACPEINLDIQPLPAATGATERAVSALEVALLRQAERLGHDPGTLLSTPLQELPLTLMPAAGALQMLAGAQLENSPRAILDGTASMLRGQAIDLEFVDALLAESGLIAQLEELAEAIGHADIARLEALYAGTESALIPTAPRPAVSRFGVFPAAWANAPGPTPSLKVVEPGELDLAMEDQARYAGSPASGPMADTAGLVIAAAGVAAPLMGPAGPAVGLAALVAGVSMTAANIYVEFMAGMLPSELQALQISAHPVQFPEDTEDQGEWSAEFSALSTGYTLSIPTILGAFPGLGKIGGKLAEIAGKLPASAELTLAIKDYVRAVITSVWDLHEDAGVTLVSPWEFKVLVDPQRAGEREYFDWRLIPGDPAFVFTDDERGYIPVAAGAMELRVETDPSRFQRHHRMALTVLSVDAISVSVSSADGRTGRLSLEPGESIELRAAVDNAKDRRVEWRAPSGGSIVTLDSGAMSSLDPIGAVYTAPAEPGTYLVEAHSLARTGPRASGIPERFGLIGIGLDDLRIEPEFACLDADESEQFTAFYDDPGGRTVAAIEWVAVLGEIDDNGRYRAPSDRGMDTIVAIDQEHPDREARATVRIGGCDCFWHLDAGGLGTFEGEVIASSRLPGGGWNVNMGSDNHDVMILVWLGVAPEPGFIRMGGEAGGAGFTLPGDAIYVTGSGECYHGFPGPCEVFEPHPPDFVVREATDQAIAARMFGDASRPVSPDRIETRRFELNFRQTAGESFVPGQWLCGDDD